MSLPACPTAPSYAELHCQTNFSFLAGASHPDELVARAAELGYAALAITDRNSLAGVVRAHAAAKPAGLKLLIGAELTPLDAPPVVLWATDRAAYGRLARLITLGRRSAPKGECHIRLADIAAHAAGLIAGVLPDESSRHTPCAAAEQVGWVAGAGPNGTPRFRPPGLTIGPPPATLERACYSYRDIFADRCYLLAELHRGPDDERRLERLVRLGRRLRVPLVAAGGVRFHVPQRRALADVLTAIRHRTTVADAIERLPPNAERYLKSPQQMARLFGRTPGALRRTGEIADRCTFSLDELRYEYPEELAPPGSTPLEHLAQLTWAGARERYPAGIPEKVRNLLRHELELIGQLHYEAYFLTVWDLMIFARSRGILCQGRGSAANSAVCYCLGVTAVDPERMNVLFERFISRERNEAPDIDVDFEHERREEVLQYVYEKYGRERAGMTAEVITYQPRLAVREVGKALGLSLDRIDALAKALDGRESVARLADRLPLAGLVADSPLGRQLLGLVEQLVHFPRHLGQHVGGMVITHGPLHELCPIENASMPGRTVIQWDKDDLDELGILKVDCLALGMLTALHKCFDLVERHHERQLTLADIPEGDTAVYDMICRADTLGLFQIESRAQMSMLPRLRPRCFYDLVIEIALVRPGPIQGNMVHPYLRRRAGQEPVTYPNDAIREVLHKTLGVPLFQKQAMRLAVVAAGFTPGEADQLRRAMGAWRRRGVIDIFQQRLIDGMLANGLTREFADQVFRQIRGFGEYGFPESHSTSFALLAYASAWLKCHYPAAYAAAMLNSQPLGFYAPAQLVRDAREHGVEVRPVDVNWSEWDCTLEDWPASDEIESHLSHPSHQSYGTYRTNGTDGTDNGKLTVALRLGLRMIGGFSKAHAAQIEAAREGQHGGLTPRRSPASRPFLSLDDFVRRTGLRRAAVARLADADAFGSLRLDRRAALWRALAQEKDTAARPLLEPLNSATADESAWEDAALPPLSPQEQVWADYQTAGLSLKAHPISFCRAALDALQVLPATRLGEARNNGLVRVAGLVLVRQRPGTARGITFVTIEDETGTANLIIHPTIWERYYQAARTAGALLAHGRLQRAYGVIHVVVSKLEDLGGRLRELKSQSRDFQ